MVSSISQDNKGFIWIGTIKGLQRYDGLRFKNYNDYRDSIGLQTEIQNIYTADSFLWLTTASGTERLDINTNKVSAHFSCGETAADPRSKYDSYTDWDGNRYLVNDLEMYKYNFQNRKMVLFVINPAPPFTTSQMVKDKDEGQVWVVSLQGLLLADNGTGKIYSTSHNDINDPLLTAMKGKSASGIMMDRHHNIWITSRVNDQLYKYDPIVKKLFVYSLFNIKKAQGEQMNESILYNNCVFEDDHYNIWVATRQAGLIKYNSLQDNFDYVLAAKSDNQSIEYNYNINCIFQDNQENIWVGTDKGINVFNPYRNYFQTIQHQKNAGSLPQNEILGFIQTPSSNILIATWGGGISIYDSALSFKRNISITGTYEQNMVWCFVQKDEENIWAGCQHGFLHTYNTVTGKITTDHPAAFENSTIRCMQKDQEGNVWFGLHNGRIAKWDKKLQIFAAYNDNATTIAQHFSPARNIFIDNSSNFWVSTEEGLKLFDPAQRVYTATFLAGTDNRSSSHAAGIQGIEQYNDSLLLTGTADDGVYFFNIKRKSFTHARASDGLPAGSVYAIKKDSAGAIWLTTEYNLYKYDPGKGSITYAIEPDIINSSFERFQFCPLHDGRWITATSAEVFLFNPGNLAKKDERSRIAITGFKVFDHPIFVDSILNAGKAVPLTYQQNFITIEFSALTFLNIGKTRYRYQLSGVDKDWVNGDGDGFASYTNLSPGRYIFSVRSADADDAPVTTFPIIITPPWYNEWWFIFICIAAAAFLVYRLVKMREKSLETKMQLDKQQYKMAEAEMNALRAQMNPHFLFNSLNSINNYILKNDADNAAGYLTKFSRLMRLILDNSRNNWVWLQSEVKALQLYAELEAFRFDNSFTYKINIGSNLNAEHIMVPPMIIQPYVENAIWHGLMHRAGGGGHLQIDISKEGEYLNITIKDNGVGREAANRMRSRYAHSQKSHGMKITAERLEIMNKVYYIDAKVAVTDALENESNGTGTIVSIKFKYTLENRSANV